MKVSIQKKNKVILGILFYNTREISYPSKYKQAFKLINMKCFKTYFHYCIMLAIPSLYPYYKFYIITSKEHIHIPSGGKEKRKKWYHLATLKNLNWMYFTNFYSII